MQRTSRHCGRVLTSQTGGEGKPVIPREQANWDIDDTRPLPGKARKNRGLGFIDKLEQVYALIAPVIRGADQRITPMNWNLPGLRFWPLNAIPIWFSTSSTTLYRRLARAPWKRDIPSWLGKTTT